MPTLKVRLTATLKAMRLPQWMKNLLLFVPLILSHRVLEADLLLRTFAAFVAFSLTASATYLVNDLADVEHDRSHPRKRRRPIASGELSTTHALLVAALLISTSIVMAYFISTGLLIMLALYTVTTVTYSLVFKRVLVVDVVILASLYTYRVIAGAFAASVPLSFWLLAFSMFVFLSLALVKRVSEIVNMEALERGEIPGRGYHTGDRIILSQIGVASGLISVLVLALYVNSSAVIELYSSPELIWLLCPVILYWICRIWMLATRGQVDEDPVLFAAKDGPTYVTALLAGVILWAAI